MEHIAIKQLLSYLSVAGGDKTPWIVLSYSPRKTALQLCASTHQSVIHTHGHTWTHEIYSEDHEVLNNVCKRPRAVRRDSGVDLWPLQYKMSSLH